MHSNDLIDRLTRDAAPVRAGGGARDLATAAALGGIGVLALVLAGYGVQPGLALAPAVDAFAMKLAFVGAIGAVALALALALARPGADAVSWRWLALPAIGLGVPALVVLAQAPPADWPALLLGGSWTRCPWRIAALSLPVAAALTLAMRRRAPIDPQRAGAAIGLLAGAVAASLYALACTETSPAFVLVWYSAGIAVSTGACWLAGPRLLRW